jgi:hypothetical protein
MGIALAIFGILKAASSAVFGILAKLPWQVWVCVGLVLSGGWLFNGGTLRDFCCTRMHVAKEPKAREYKVLGVPDGSHLLLGFGLNNRRESKTALFGIRIPASVTAAARFELIRLAGDSVYASEASQKVSSTYDALRPPPAIGIVYGPEGCCQISLIKAGLALNTTAIAEWKSAEDKAKKSKTGIWGK